MPRLTVVTPIYNGARFLAHAIESILSQSFAEFEYILIDDGSTDDSYTVAAAFARRDARIQLVRQARNQGISRTLNRALTMAAGEYVAILDQDDLAREGRLAQQVAYLDAHPALVLVGSQVEIVDSNGAPVGVRAMPAHPGVARWDFLLRCCVQHSAATMRRAAAISTGGYALHHRYAAEYDLFWRMAQQGDVVNLPDVLAAHRIDASQTSHTKAQIQHAEVTLWQWALYRGWLGLETTPAAVQALYAANRDQPLADAGQFLTAADLLEALYRTYCNRVKPDTATRALLDEEVAWKLFVFASAPMQSQPALATALLARATRYDPALTSRARAKARMAAP